MRASLTVAILFAGVATLAFGTAASAAEVTDTIRYAIDDEQNINRLPQVIAEREGFFAREGVKVELVTFASSFRSNGPANAPTVREAMDNGAVDMTRQQLPLLINDTVTNRVKQRYVGVGLAVSNPVYFLVVRPEIKNFADLKGKTVTLTGLADGITVWTQKLMAQHGLKKEDTTIKSIAGSDARLACMKAGECAAASMAQPAVFEALAAGFHTLGMTNEIGTPLYQLEIARPEWAASHRDAIVKYLRATSAAKRFIMDPRNRDVVVRVTMEMMRLPENRTREMMAYIWDAKNAVLQPDLDMAKARAGIALLGEFGILKAPLPAAETYIDASFARAAGL